MGKFENDKHETLWQKHKEYWDDRFVSLEQSTHSTAKEAISDAETAFRQAQRETQLQINAWYARFAKNNEVSLLEARRMLKEGELEELKWDVNQYIKYGKQNAVDGRWIKQLENASAKHHISQLEALKIRTQQAWEVAFAKENNIVNNAARKVTKDTYLKSIYEVHKGFNTGVPVKPFDNKTLDAIIKKPWTADGRQFSSRVWKQKEAMVSVLHQQLTQVMMQGKSIDEAVKALEPFVKKKVKDVTYAAKRLITTELAYFHSYSQKQSYITLGVKEYKIVATLDFKTSEICQTLDRQVFPVSKMEPGVTAPPFHPCCRSVTSPYFDDEWAVGERAARGKDGKTYHVPSSMSYADWKASLVDNDGAGLREIVKPTKTAKDVDIGDVFSTDDPKEADAFFDNQKSHNNWYDSLSKKVKDAIYTYTTGRFAFMNDFIRFGLKVAMEREKVRFLKKSSYSMLPAHLIVQRKLIPVCDVLNSAFGGYVAEKSFRVYRGVSGSIPLFDNLKVGDVVTLDTAFFSTSMLKSEAMRFMKRGKGSSKYFFDVLVRKGNTSGFYIGPNSEFPRQKEFLIKPGALFKVLDIKKSGNVLMISVEVY